MTNVVPLLVALGVSFLVSFILLAGCLFCFKNVNHLSIRQYGVG